MKPAIWAMFWLVLPGAAAADDLRVNQLEQEVRELKRQMLTLSRQVDELKRTRLPVTSGAPAVQPAPEPGTRWIDAARWQKVTVGMKELDVLALLGPPTSTREDGGARLLFYALEIQPGGFLSGSVTLRDRVVSEVRRPELR